MEFETKGGREAMWKEAYKDIEASKDYREFYFVSEGTKGKIRKVIVFRENGDEDFYELGLADINENDELDWDAVTNNGDTLRILGTIFLIIEMHIKRFPDHMIIFEGSTPARTRLYRMTIGLNYDRLSERFQVMGSKDGEMIPFVKNVDYDWFVVINKIY